MSRILDIGGYGGFGARLSRHLVAAGHHVLVGGRSLEKAQRFCSTLAGAEAVQLDRSGDIKSVIGGLQPDLVIDAAGPFQQSGYDIPRACIAQNCSYLDLADATDFVAGITELNAAARVANVSVISGASSVPALSGAVTRKLAKGLDRVSQVDIAISASTRSTASRAVTGAILSYAGRPVRLRRGGRWAEGIVGSDLRRARFEVSGVKPLTRRWLALCDVPDLRLLPRVLPGEPAVTFRAGSDRVQQIFALWAASWLVRLGVLRSLRPFGGIFVALQKATMWSNSSRSAMEVTLRGWRDGQRIERRWTLVAEEGSGPEIPTVAATLLASDVVANRLVPGARDGSRELDFERFETLFAGLPLRYEFTERVLEPTLYRRAMGNAFDRLPRSVRQTHEVNGDAGAAGAATVLVGKGFAARLVRTMMRFPPSGDYAVNVAFIERDGKETWIRDFGGHRFKSVLSQQGNGVAERFGPLNFVFDLQSDDDGLCMVLRGWSVLGIPMPLRLAPRIDAREWEEDGEFHFAVEASLPLVGPIVGYRGSLKSNCDDKEESLCSRRILRRGGLRSA